MKLEPKAIEWAIKSLARFSDTDLFPRPIEILSISEDSNHSAQELSNLDLSALMPGASRRFIVPKHDLSYRQATQLDPLDSLFMTALVYSFGNDIEVRRRPRSDQQVFSYRFQPSAEGELYATSHAWNQFWARCYKMAEGSSTVLVADIADFYNQIYHHTVENQLGESGWPNQAIKWVVRLLESTSAKVSRGVPVGPHPVHLLAEASLIPVDNSLAARGIQFCRFVDDIIIFTNSDTDARAALYALAEILDKQQRLHLQNIKTEVLPSGKFRARCEEMIEDRPINDLEKQIVDIIRKHSKGNPYQTVLISQLSDDELRSFEREAIETILQDYLDANPPDFVRLRWFLRRMAQVGHPGAVEYCLQHFERLTPAVSDLCHYLIAVSGTLSSIRWTDVGTNLVTVRNAPLLAANEYFQLSVLSLFSRIAELNHLPQLLREFSSSSPTVRREIILAAATAGHADWLRELKEQFPAMDPWTRRAFLYACGRLPKEERRFFLGTVGGPSPLEKLIIRHAKSSI